MKSMDDVKIRLRDDTEFEAVRRSIMEASATVLNRHTGIVVRIDPAPRDHGIIGVALLRHVGRRTCNCEARER